MTPTAELRTSLRRMVSEIIPTGKTADATRFSDAEIDDLLTISNSLEEAAALGWERKADRAYDDRGGVLESTAGAERTKWVDPADFAAFCMERARYYRGLIPASESGGGSQFVYIGEPVFVGVNHPPALDPFVDDFTRVGS